MTPGGPGAPDGLTPAEMTTVQLLEVAAARSRPHKVVAAELRARAERLRSALAYLGGIGLTDYGRGELDALKHINKPEPPSHTCPDKPDEPCPACTPAPTGTTRGRDE